MAQGPVELDRPAWALTFEPCSILGIHQHPSTSWASGVSSSSQCHVFRLVIVTILVVTSLNSIPIGILFHVPFLINCRLIIVMVKTDNLMDMLKNEVRQLSAPWKTGTSLRSKHLINLRHQPLSNLQFSSHIVAGSPCDVVMSRHLQFGRVLEVTSPIAKDLALKLDNTLLGLGSHS
ncbi:hypothetical protein FOXYSP1_03101 [Fusarium oxysporum f. sp. phaseoli]